MMKHLVGVCALLVLLTVATSVLADIVPEPFEADEGYLAGTALSSFYWDLNTDPDENVIDTSGVLDIEDVGGEHGQVVKLTANGPDPGPTFPEIAAISENWDGPGRNGSPLSFAVDIQKGSGSPLDSNVWDWAFNRGNGANILTLEGGLGTFRLKTASGSTATFILGQGWNQVAVVNDLSANPNAVLYLNGIEIASINATAGPLQSGTTAVAHIVVTRLERGGTDDGLVGTVRFDNVIAANEDILKFLSGDVSHDGIVDVSDIQVIAVNYLGPGPAGDANNDGIVDVSDIQVIAAHYLDGAGHSPYPGNGGGTGTSVPEPSTVVLMALGLVFGAAHVYRRRRVAK